jgi:hypothetical protein
VNLLVRKIIYDYMYPVDLENNETPDIGINKKPQHNNVLDIHVRMEHDC